MQTLGLLLLIISCITVGWFGQMYWQIHQDSFQNPLTDLAFTQPEQPLRRYNLKNIHTIPTIAEPIEVLETLETDLNYTRYLVSFATHPAPATMSAVLTVPTTVQPDDPTIVMLRGYVPPSIYEPGVGTQNAARYYAENGYVSIAPDFLGYGQSDPEPEDTWLGRFIKPVQIMDLLASLEEYGVSGVELPPTSNVILWGHSNGGQIALATLAGLRKSIPTTLWAPVTAPFPYSILYFGDELEDEGKSQRAWISLLERNYDVTEFSLTKNLNLLTGPIRIHHGTSDDAALVWWTREFAQKVATENNRRVDVATNQATATEASELAPEEILPAIDLTVYEYPGADHNLQPSWSTVVERDLAWFETL